MIPDVWQARRYVCCVARSILKNHHTPPYPWPGLCAERSHGPWGTPELILHSYESLVSRPGEECDIGVPIP